ncbi:uncharacterized protein LOC133323155 [Musca vetustissima]|uniref:uncharacterized protein LOC133323155 n=1 Tax=Musca vetustissima TaxID=27455 RepID=UPI002AB78F03|nr:uncharacterized protein LOC133323155 [Musca vetustissima]
MAVNEVKVRDSASRAIKRYLEASKRDELAFNLEMAQNFCLLLEEQWRRFTQAQEKVDLSCGVEYEVEEHARIQAEDWYLLAKSNIDKLLVPHSTTPENEVAYTQNSPADVPVATASIQLPTFDGSPGDWVSFHDAFNSLIHTNKNITSGHKLHYLRSCLKGEALQAISGLKSKFWEVEEPCAKKHYTVEEIACEEHFKRTHSLASDGRSIIQLPFRDSLALGKSRGIALRSFTRLEARLVNDENLRAQYNAFIDELISMEHMELVPMTYEPTEYCNYMPHHAVLKDTSSTTKLRVVFNASMKTSTGLSLNDTLMVVPQLQGDLYSILLRFRQNRFAMMADVEKMHRQVYVAKKDTDFQGIVWRRSPAEPVMDYHLLRVTYGVASASYYAVKCMQHTAKNANERVARVITRGFYMDDMLSGASSEEELLSLQADVSKHLSEGGFELRKWATNSAKLTQRIPQTTHLVDDEEVRTLGNIWNTADDSLSLLVNLRVLPPKISKRLFLSDTSMLFDPLGLIAPCTIRSKIWMQELWSANVNWDEDSTVGLVHQIPQPLNFTYSLTL